MTDGRHRYLASIIAGREDIPARYDTPPPTPGIAGAA